MPLYHGIGYVYDAVPEGATRGVMGGSTVTLQAREKQYRKNCKWFGQGRLVPVRKIEGDYADRDQFFGHLRAAELLHIIAQDYFANGRNQGNPLTQTFSINCDMRTGAGRPMLSVESRFQDAKVEVSCPAYRYYGKGTGGTWVCILDANHSGNHRDSLAREWTNRLDPVKKQAVADAIQKRLDRKKAKQEAHEQWMREHTPPAPSNESYREDTPIWLNPTHRGEPRVLKKEYRASLRAEHDLQQLPRLWAIARAQVRQTFPELEPNSLEFNAKVSDAVRTDSERTTQTV